MASSKKLVLGLGGWDKAIFESLVHNLTITRVQS